MVAVGERLGWRCALACCALKLRADEMGCDVWDLLQPARVKGEVDEGGRSMWLMGEARLSLTVMWG